MVVSGRKVPEYAIEHVEHAGRMDIFTAASESCRNETGDVAVGIRCVNNKLQSGLLCFVKKIEVSQNIITVVTVRKSCFWGRTMLRFASVCGTALVIVIEFEDVVSMGA